MQEIATRVEQVLESLRALASPEVREGMLRFGVDNEKALGVKVPQIRALARTLGRNHELALGLWDTGVHEARHLASMIDEPAKVTREQLESWVRQFDSWDVVDGTCLNLILKTPFAWQVAQDWCHREPEFERRAGFAMIAVLAIHQKKVPDQRFLEFFPLIETYATDPRNFVKKAVNWALRQLGKRSPSLRGPSLVLAEKLAGSSSTPARWVGKDALRELSRVEASSEGDQGGEG